MRAPDEPATAEQRRARKRQALKEHRARVSAGLSVYLVVADGDVINDLVRRDYIKDGETTNTKSVSRAISALLLDLAHGRLKPVSSTHVWTG